MTGTETLPDGGKQSLGVICVSGAAPGTQVDVSFLKAPCSSGQECSDTQSCYQVPAAFNVTPHCVDYRDVAKLITCPKGYSLANDLFATPILQLQCTNTPE